MTSILESCVPVNAQQVFEAQVDEAVQHLCQTLGARLSAILVATVKHIVGREHAVRREKVARDLVRPGRCCRCGSTRSQDFSRNGYRPRKPLLTTWGEVPFELPRVCCQCGGSVRLDFGELLQPYQRIGGDVDAQIRRLGSLAVSLRQMQGWFGQLRVGTLALRTLHDRLQLLTDLDPQQESVTVPPILQVDAIWVTLLRPNGQVRRDRKGRKRAVKGRYKVPIMIAMGIWPESGRREILLWGMGKDESAEAWTEFLGTLEAQGIRGAEGLQLLIHDGGTGLCAALQTVWFNAAQQRCLFHKLRNLSRVLHLPDGLTAAQKKQQRHKILRDFRHIWEAPRYETMLRRYLHVVRTYRATQPEAVATLRRDFRATVTYYALEQQFPGWERKYLRTTSHLERFNRNVRRRVRAANAYHSDSGVKAMLAQVVQEFHQTQPQG